MIYRPHSERGAALLIAMLLVVVIGSVTTTLTGTTTRTAQSCVLARGRVEARFAAEGGIETARVRLAIDAHWPGAELLIGRTVVTVTVTPGTDGSFQVEAQAACPVRGAGLPVRSTVFARLAPTVHGLATAAWSER